jgi:hypothetical protein
MNMKQTFTGAEEEQNFSGGIQPYTKASLVPIGDRLLQGMDGVKA